MKLNPESTISIHSGSSAPGKRFPYGIKDAAGDPSMKRSHETVRDVRVHR